VCLAGSSAAWAELAGRARDGAVAGTWLSEAAAYCMGQRRRAGWQAEQGRRSWGGASRAEERGGGGRVGPGAERGVDRCGKKERIKLARRRGAKGGGDGVDQGMGRL
jgi:hypothetical protein